MNARVQAAGFSEMTVNLDHVRRERLASALSDAHKQVAICEEAIKQNQLKMLELRKNLIAALARLSDAKQRYDQGR
jgi:hypothetical protein